MLNMLLLLLGNKSFSYFSTSFLGCWIGEVGVRFQRSETSAADLASKANVVVGNGFRCASSFGPDQRLAKLVTRDYGARR